MKGTLRKVTSVLGLAPRRLTKPGTAAGIDHAFGSDDSLNAVEVRIRCFDYGPDHFVEREFDTVDELLDEPRPEGTRVRWINIDGLNPNVVRNVRQRMNIHTLAAEDVLHVPQRPRMEIYDGHLFITARMVGIFDERGVISEQVSMFMFDDLVITFQEYVGDVFDPIRVRIRTAGSRLRNRGAGFLVYAIMDAIVDHCFPLLDRYTAQLDELEDDIMTDPRPELLQQILAKKKDLTSLRRIVWPMRELVDALERSESFDETTTPFLRDVHTHSLQLLDIVDHLRETAASLVDLYMSMVSNKMNEVMKVLTVIATLFIPITFIAGVYGMNFEYLPELKSPYAYPTFWGVCITIAASLLWFFRRRRWI